MKPNERRDKAVEVLKDAYHTYGMHPTREQENTINQVIATWVGGTLTPAQITEAMATCHDIHARRTTMPDLVYQGQDVEPGDALYSDALGEYEEDNETTLYAIIREIEKE